MTSLAILPPLVARHIVEEHQTLLIMPSTYNLGDSKGTRFVAMLVPSHVRVIADTPEAALQELEKELAI